MDILSILIVAGITLACTAIIAGLATGRGLDLFGAGFLPYKEAGWPRGVQEGEPIPWKWSAMAERGVAPVDREPAPDAGVEIFEVDPDLAADLVEIGPRHVHGGTSIRDR